MSNVFILFFQPRPSASTPQCPRPVWPFQHALMWSWNKNLLNLTRYNRKQPFDRCVFHQFVTGRNKFLFHWLSGFLRRRRRQIAMLLLRLDCLPFCMTFRLVCNQYIKQILICQIKFLFFSLYSLSSFSSLKSGKL